MIEFNKRILKNGATLLFEKRAQPLISIFVAAKMGAANETAKEKGISHFLEHMLFRDTKKRSSTQTDKLIEKTGGLRNGFTDEEITAFEVKLPSKHLELGIDILTDMIQNPKFSIEDIEKERKIIFEEIKMHHDLPQSYIIRKLQSLLYASPFGTPLIGSFETLSSLNQASLKNLHSKYIPRNLIFSFVGKASIEEIEEILARKFILKNRKLQISMPKIVKLSSETVEKRQNMDQAYLALGFHMPNSLQKEKYAAEIFSSVLVQGMSSKIYQEIREKRGMAYHIDGAYSCGKGYGFELIYAGTSSDKVKIVKELILKEIRKMDALNSKDFDDTKEKLIGNFELSREKTDDVARALIYEENAEGAEEYYNFIQNISKVKLQEVQKLARIKNFSSATLIPK